jgi:ABC-type transport system involved in cytochrome c biogenesis permease subunit
MKKFLPWIITGVMALWMVSTLRATKEDGFHVREFARLPVLLNGRVQPWDSVARNTLLQIRDKQSVYIETLDDKGKLVTKTNLTAVQWMLEVMFKPELADTRPVFRVDHPDLKGLLGVRIEEKHITWTQIAPHWEKLVPIATNAAALDASLRSPYDRAALKLANAGKLYRQLKNTLQAETSQDFIVELLDYLQSLEAGRTAVFARQEGKTYDEAAFDRLMGHLERYNMMRSGLPLVVPPHHPEQERDNWTNLGDQLMGAFRGERLHGSVTFYAAMASSFRANDTAKFNKAVGDYTALLQKDHARDYAKGGRELFYNVFQAFYKASALYVVAFLCGMVYWFNWSSWARRSAVWLILLALVIHTAGLIFRMVLEGRPPVTNLYSSAIFIGWGSVILGLILERFYRDGIGAVVSAVMGFVTLVIAHNLSLGGDTMEMMRAVLDTNFWLATHVVVVTLGYAATFVAGFLALLFVVRGFFTGSLPETARKNLSRMVYGIICFATLFSLVGTVLGGIWADQSWGRFWGWDPKENGALMIVIWNALILHARWGGIFKERGIMNLAIFGNIVTAWSWFGTNMLGIGLHSYGFTDSGFMWMMLFITSQLLLIGVGLLPTRLWASYQKDAGKDSGSAGPGKSAAKPASIPV